MPKFRVGSTVRMTEDALENYGEQYRDVVLEVTVVSRSEREHPGYDMGMSPMPLYDFMTEDGKDFPNSLYTYELEAA